ncbi:hypothetical protein PT286_09170 [Neisseriaceae bacterium ESL0693]|nr:hypothetical protein [Neisseriaceae bacterium ESL0693]
MKNIRYLFLCGLLISLTGCYGSVVRFWNSGPYISKAEDKAYDECMDEYDKIDTEPRNPNLATEESRVQRSKGANWIANCVKNKGF